MTADQKVEYAAQQAVKAAAHKLDCSVHHDSL
jgi:hypothetical protein